MNGILHSVGVAFVKPVRKENMVLDVEIGGRQEIISVEIV